MTDKHKTALMLIFATMLALAAVIHGFSIIPNPAEQRDIKFDHKRVTDLGMLKANIDDYYRTNRRLPKTLHEITTTGTYSYYSTYSANPLSQTDPQTNQPYEYSVTNPSKYQLCAIFSKDSYSEKDSYDRENYNYAIYKKTFNHPQGRFCFDFDAPYVYQYNVVPSVNPTFGAIVPASGGPGGGGGSSSPIRPTVTCIGDCTYQKEKTSNTLPTATPLPAR